MKSRIVLERPPTLEPSLEAASLESLDCESLSRECESRECESLDCESEWDVGAEPAHNVCADLECDAERRRALSEFFSEPLSELFSEPLSELFSEPLSELFSEWLEEVESFESLGELPDREQESVSVVVELEAE